MKSKITLLKILTNFNIGGTERQFANLVTRLDSTQFDVHLACLQRVGDLFKELEALRVPQPEFRIGGSLYSPKTFWQGLRLARYIRKHRIQIVHTYGLYPNLFGVPAARLAGTPIVIASIRDTGDILTPIQRRAQQMVCRLADCVLVNAEAIRDRLISQGYLREKIVVIRNGITLSRFSRQEKGCAMRRKLGLPDSGRLVIVFSRLNRMKGVEYFLEASVILAKRFPDVHFIIAGDGAIRAELEEQARRLGLGQRIVFTGFRNDIPELLAEATVSVLPSLSEGMSNTLLESMAAGLPVVATRVGGNPEVVEHGVTGLLVPPRDAAALADATSVLLHDEELASRFGRAGLRRVSDLFSVESSVHQTESLYRQLVGAHERELASSLGAATGERV